MTLRADNQANKMRARSLFNLILGLCMITSIEIVSSFILFHIAIQSTVITSSLFTILTNGLEPKFCEVKTASVNGLDINVFSF